MHGTKAHSLSLAELETACALAHARVRGSTSRSTPGQAGELQEALEFLGEAIDRGVDAAIVQDIGLVGSSRRLSRLRDPRLHADDRSRRQRRARDAELGIDRVVLARENTLDDIRAIRSAVPGSGSRRSFTARSASRTAASATCRG